MMKIGVPKELHDGEMRVAMTPDVTKLVIQLGYDVVIESDAGALSNFSDEKYIEAGATIENDRASLYQQCELILKVRAPGEAQGELALLREGQNLISFIQPGQNEALLEQLVARKLTVLAMDSVPRISRAQKMDALSSMANIAGYRAVVEAAQHFGRFFTGQITAAGRIEPAKVLVIGAGVAGLSAIGTAKSMGAIVRAFDTRPEVKEQVESMDGEFLLLDFAGDDDGTGEGGYAKVMSDEFIKAEMALFAEQAKDVDIIITTALIPGKPAPELITEEMVRSMKDGSVIVDLAAEMGGNCKLSEPDKVVVKYGVSIIGYTNLPSRLPTQSSQLYATNLKHLLTELTPGKDGVIHVNMEDEVIRGATVVKNGELTWPPPVPKLSAAPKKDPEPVKAVLTEEKKSPWGFLVPFCIGATALLGLGAVAPPSFMSHFTVFVLACFVGYMVIWNVSPSLHTPLMSVTNAISSIIIIGALLQISSDSYLIRFLSGTAILITSVNIFGGFAVTQRMLEMFRK